MIILPTASRLGAFPATPEAVEETLSSTVRHPLLLTSSIFAVYRIVKDQTESMSSRMGPPPTCGREGPPTSPRTQVRRDSVLLLTSPVRISPAHTEDSGEVPRNTSPRIPRNLSYLTRYKQTLNSVEQTPPGSSATNNFSYSYCYPSALHSLYSQCNPYPPSTRPHLSSKSNLLATGVSREYT